MTLENILPQVQKLSNQEKLALIEATAQMLQTEQAVKETAAPFSVEETTDPPAVSGPDETNADLSFEEWQEQQFEQGRRKIAALAQELLSRPDPPREKMLKYGLFKGQLSFDEEDFKAAEWHPTDEELENGGFSLRR